MSVSLSVAALPLASTPVMGTGGGGGVATEDCGGELAGKEDAWEDLISFRQKIAKNGVFRPKNTVFGPIFNRFFLSGKGGYPPPPLSGRRPAKKLAEKS